MSARTDEAWVEERRLVCEICARRGWGGFVGEFRYKSTEPEDWRFMYAGRRESTRGTASGRVLWTHPNTQGVSFRPGDAPLKVRCPDEGHRLAEMTVDDVIEALRGPGFTVRWPVA